jgi:hypothetical protein
MLAAAEILEKTQSRRGGGSHNAGQGMVVNQRRTGPLMKKVHP